jgi:exonuclease SbcC
VFPKIQQEFPCIVTSDACDRSKLQYTRGHSAEVIGRNYSWIKADPTFEGLKQIIYEPKLRVRVQADNPCEEEAFAKIETLEVDLPAAVTIKDKESDEAMPFCIQGKQEINFSSNLTCIIGGRGSGKSTLVHILYNLVPKMDTDRLARVNSPLLNLQVGSKDVLGKVRTLAKCNLPPSTEFFLQNEVEKSAKDIDEMSKLIKSRLYGLSAMGDAQKDLVQIEGEWQATANDLDALISAYDKMTLIDQQIASVKRQSETLKKQTDVISSIEYKTLQKEIEESANSISGFDTYEKESKRILLEISALIKSINRLDWSKYEGQSILTSLVNELEKKKAELQEAIQRAKASYDEADYATTLNDKKTQLKKFLKDKGLSPENISEVAAATQQIAQLEEEVKRFRQERVPYQEVYDQRHTVLEMYKEAYTTYRNELGAVADKLHSNIANLKYDDQQTNISFQLKTNDQVVKNEVADFVKISNASRVSLRSDFIQNVLFENSPIRLPDIVADGSKIVEIVNSSAVADVHTQILRELVSDPIFVEKLHLRMQRHYFGIENIQIQTKLDEKLLQNTSFGERCGIVIAIVLVAGTNPIIIDQPEDNLDGKYVSKVLVPLIRGQKQKRQIILVTRDANIAIGGDAELIVILDTDQQGTALLPATIENKDMRPQYIWILDGGEKAFQTREEKYSIRRAQ